MKIVYIAEKEELQELIKESIREEIKSIMHDLTHKPISERISFEEAQNYLNLSKSKIYKLTSSKEIPYHKLGKRIFFYRQELDQWINKYARHYKTMEDRVNVHMNFLAKKKR